MDRDAAFLVYLASMVAAINLGLLLYGVSNPGPYLGLYALAYVPGAYFAKPRRSRIIWTLGGVLVASFIAYSVLGLVGWLR